MDIPSRVDKRGFLHGFLNESFVGDGITDTKLLPIQEISKDEVDKIVNYVGKHGVHLSKLASFLGVHYLKAYDTAKLLAAIGILNFKTRDWVSVAGTGVRNEGSLEKELLVWDPSNSNVCHKKMCELFYVSDDSSIKIDRVVVKSTNEDVTDLVYVPKSMKEELKKKSRTSYERMKSNSKFGRLF